MFETHCTPTEVEAIIFSGAAAPHAEVKHLSVPLERCGVTTISSELLESTWKKAEKLLNTAESICRVPSVSHAMRAASDTASKSLTVSKTKCRSM